MKYFLVPIEEKIIDDKTPNVKTLIPKCEHNHAIIHQYPDARPAIVAALDEPEYGLEIPEKNDLAQEVINSHISWWELHPEDSPFKEMIED